VNRVFGVYPPTFAALWGAPRSASAVSANQLPANKLMPPAVPARNPGDLTFRGYLAIFNNLAFLVSIG
jgi:hypothetical protein